MSNNKKRNLRMLFMISLITTSILIVIVYEKTARGVSRSALTSHQIYIVWAPNIVHCVQICLLIEREHEIGHFA